MESEFLNWITNVRETEKGGPGSGNHGHAGRPGHVGGSAAGGGGKAGRASEEHDRDPLKRARNKFDDSKIVKGLLYNFTVTEIEKQLEGVSDEAKAEIRVARNRRLSGEHLPENRVQKRRECLNLINNQLIRTGQDKKTGGKRGMLTQIALEKAIEGDKGYAIAEAIGHFVDTMPAWRNESQAALASVALGKAGYKRAAATLAKKSDSKALNFAKTNPSAKSLTTLMSKAHQETIFDTFHKSLELWEASDSDLVFSKRIRNTLKD